MRKRTDHNTSVEVLEGLKGSLEQETSKPLYRQISDGLRGAIEAGKIPNGTKLPTERDLTGILQVSRRTVRAALAELVEGGLLSATQGRGSFVLQPASISEVHILVVEEFLPSRWGGHPMHYDWLQATEAVSNCKVSYKYAPGLNQLIETLQSPPKGQDALLIFRPNQEWIGCLRGLAAGSRPLCEVPLLVINRNLTGTGISFVTANHRENGVLAARSLLEKGARTLAYIGSSPTAEFMRETFEGFRQEVSRQGASSPDALHLLLDTQSPSDHEAAIVSFLETRCPIAVVVAGSALTKPAREAISARAPLLPQPFVVVYITEEECLEKGDTAVIYQTQEIVDRGVSALCEMVRGRVKNPHEEFVPSAIFRTGANV